MKQIINHFTDTDLYTLSVALVVMNKFPRAHIKYNFFDRNNSVYSKWRDGPYDSPRPASFPSS